MLQPQVTFWRNLRDLPTAITLQSIAAGFLVVVVGYTGPLLIVIQAAQQNALPPAQTASWIWAVTIGYGTTSIVMSLWYRQPLTAPWSTAGAALLVTSLAEFTLPQAVGAYVLAALAHVLLGMSGLFERVIRLVPPPIFLGMLAGILLRFGLGLFTILPERPVMVLAMIAVFVLLRRIHFRAPTLGALIVGVLIAAGNGDIRFASLEVQLTQPVVTMPEFTLNAALSLALPLFLLSLTSQYAPGVGVLQSSGYRAPINGILIIIGAASMFLALFGGHGQSLGALTAAMLTNPEAHPDPTRRYAASVAMGAWYILFGLFGATVLGLFAAFPAALVASVAGLALSGTIATSLANGLNVAEGRDAAIITFLCAGANFTLLGIGAPFWALVIGMAAHLLLTWRRKGAER